MFFEGILRRIPVAPCFGVLPCYADCFRLATYLFLHVTGVSTLCHYQNVLILPQGGTCLLRFLFPLSRSVSSVPTCRGHLFRRRRNSDATPVTQIPQPCQSGLKFKIYDQVLQLPYAV